MSGPGGGAMNLVLQPKLKKAKNQALWYAEKGIKDLNKNYDNALSYQRPYADFGTSSLNEFQGWLDNPEFSDPSYNWRFNEGQKAVENSAAARGGALSGNALRAVTDYGQNAASGEYGNEFARWMQRLGIGSSAAANMSNIDTSRGSQLLSARTGMGQNAFNNTLASAAEIRMAEQGLNNILQSWIPAQFGGGKPTSSGSGPSGVSGGDSDFMSSWNSGGGSSGWGSRMMSQYGGG